MEYLVESHMDGYYVSSNDYECIIATCESCGDSDTIITSWDSEEDKYMSLLNLVTNTYFSDVESIKKYIDLLYDCYDIPLPSFIEEYIYIRSCVKKEKKDFIICLKEEKIIDSKISKLLLSINTKTFNKEMKLTHSIDFSYLEKGNHIKVKKMTK